MRRFLKNRPLVIAIGAVLILLIVALATSGDRTLTIVESAFGGAIQPVRSFASRASLAIVGFAKNIFNTTDADIENQQLKVYVSQLEQTVNELDAIKAENERLKALLNFTEATPELNYTTGVVIGRSQGIWFDTFTLNIGKAKGVEKNMPIVNSSGLIGRITSVGATYSKAVCIIDSSMSVSVTIERTRDTGMVRGTLTPGNDVDTLELYYLPADADLLPGDKVITSGIGGIYPKGILVGEVREVSRSSSSERNATVTPAVDFRHIEEVMVIGGMEALEGLE